MYIIFNSNRIPFRADIRCVPDVLFLMTIEARMDCRPSST